MRAPIKMFLTHFLEADTTQEKAFALYNGFGAAAGFENIASYLGAAAEPLMSYVKKLREAESDGASQCPHRGDTPSEEYLNHLAALLEKADCVDCKGA